MDEYPKLPDGSRVPFTPAERSRLTDEDLRRVLVKHGGAATVSGKSRFPADWSDDDVHTAVDVTLSSPSAGLSRSGDKITFDRHVKGVLVRVHVRVDGAEPIFWTAYPPNGTITA